MRINPNLKDIFQHHNIDYDEGILYLLSLYFGVKMDEIKFEKTIKQVNICKIVERDLNTKSLTWNEPLFEGQNTAWEWLSEYRKMFTAVNKSRGGSMPAITVRMKKFFAEQPHVRKEDVMEATRMYMRTISNPQYLQSADYFISKGMGADRTSKLLEHIDILMEIRKKSQATSKMM